MTGAAPGCVDGNVQAQTRTQVACFFIIPQAMDIALHNGYCRYTKEMVGKEVGDVTKMETFDEIKEAVFDEIRHLMRMANERINVEMIAERDLFPDVFRSSLMKDGVKVGKDMFNRRFQFENGAAVLGAVGAVNAGMVCMIKKLIFDEKNIPWHCSRQPWMLTGKATTRCVLGFCFPAKIRQQHSGSRCICS